MNALPQIAFAPGEPLLLAIDGATLVAYDAELGTPKWKLAFEHELAAVVFASLRALPQSSGSPWRSPASSCEAVAIDVTGGVHAVDATAGTVLGTHAMEGKPRAAAGRGEVLAVALADRVLLWREGRTLTRELETIAMAFSRDGTTLGLATKQGDLVLADAGTLHVRAKHELCLDVNAMTAAKDGWIIATDRELRSIDRDGAGGPVMAGSVQHLTLDGAGDRLALHRSDTSITVYAWPSLVVERRITLGSGHHFVDLAFGEGDALAVGIDRGEAAIVDVEACTAVRPDRGWSLEVGGTTKRAAPAPRALPAAPGAVVGAIIMAAILAVAALARSSRPVVPSSPNAVLQPAPAAAASAAVTETASDAGP